MCIRITSSAAFVRIGCGLSGLIGVWMMVARCCGLFSVCNNDVSRNALLKRCSSAFARFCFVCTFCVVIVVFELFFCVCVFLFV